MTKKEIRKIHKQKRGEFSSEQIENKSIEIANQLLKLNIWEYTYFHLFLSIKEQKEIDTENILHILFAKNKEVVISKSNFQNNSLSHFLLTENTILKKNKYDIPEPQNGLPVPENMIDVVFIPLLAYDSKGNRIGYGKGFYDNFLSKCEPDVVKIGLSFFEPIDEIKDIRQDDIPLNFCITPSKIYEFK